MIAQIVAQLSDKLHHIAPWNVWANGWLGHLSRHASRLGLRA
jgi:hypothetical protein